MSDYNRYLYVDTAIGGARNRNQVMKYTDFDPPKDARDCFTTYLRFTQDLLEYAKNNLSPKAGKPSVSKYPGAAKAAFLPLDFDCSEDPMKAVAEARYFMGKWEKDWSLPPEALRIYWSGMKGISIEIPDRLFGGFEPSTNIADHLKNLAVRMTPGAKTLDTTIYEKLRLWRVPNTRHSGSGLCKVKLTIQEFAEGVIR